MTEPMDAGTTLPVIPRLFTPEEADALVQHLEASFRRMDPLLVRVREIQDLLEDEASYWGGDVSRAPPPDQTRPPAPRPPRGPAGPRGPRRGAWAGADRARRGGVRGPGARGRGQGRGRGPRGLLRAAGRGHRLPVLAAGGAPGRPLAPPRGRLRGSEAP